MTIDEVQRAPHLLLAIKRAVDQRRVPGQFVLTGSANLFLDNPPGDLALHLSGEGKPRGCHLDNMVLSDILVWREAQHRVPQALFWRTSKGAEVDFVLETDRGLLPIEIKSGERIRAKDHRHLQVFLEEYSDSCRGGLVFHAGDETYWAVERVLAVPWWRVL